MSNSQESRQPNNHQNPSRSPNKKDLESNLFAFLSKEEKPLNPPQSFFSKNGLSRDILQVTQAEPDLCLEAFYALYHTLRPQIESQSNVSFKDAWTRFIGGSIMKGILTPPEKLITERRTRDIKRILSEPEGEHQIFNDLDQVGNSILNLKQKINDYPEEILYKKEVIASLTLIQDFYQSFRDKIKGFIQMILQKERANASYILESDALEDFLEHKAIMMSDIFPNHWAYRIPRRIAQKLLSKDLHGHNLKNNINDPSNHRVISLPEKDPEPLVFFKANGNPPIQPEKEFMLDSLYRHLQIPVPETALLILTDVFEANPEDFYAVQASEAVLGESSLQACREETAFDQEAYVAQTIGALLTNPSDGSFKNFKYSPKYKTVISIDNDKVFKPEVIGDDDEKTVNVKSILYLLPQIDLPIPQSIKDSFSTLDPHLTICCWLQDFSKKNKKYEALFEKLIFQKMRCIYQNLLPQSEFPSLVLGLQQKVLVDHELHSGFFPQILLSKDLLSSLIEKLQLIEKTLLSKPSVSTQMLFEEITPVLGKYYRKLRVEFSDPEEALEALWGNKKNGVDYSKISSLLDNEEINDLLNSCKIELGENLSPETLFKEYRDLLISQESPVDQFIRRQNQKKKKNILNLQIALKELQFLIQEELANSQSLREIVDFCDTLSKTTHNLAKDITSLLSNLPYPELKWLLTLEKYFLRPDSPVPIDLSSYSQTILGAFMNKRIFLLTRSEDYFLFTVQGSLQKNSSLTGRSVVTCFPQNNPEFYLKQYPEFPGYDFASTLFMRLFGITSLPYQELIILSNRKTYPVLLTQKIDGHPVHKVWSNQQAFQNLDPFHTGLLIISAMLLNPEDGKEDNFILSPDGKYLIPIDNDHYFLPSTSQKEKSLWNAWTINTALQTKTLLFCLDEMNRPIPPDVRKHIISLDFDSILISWMKELVKVEDRYNNLVGQEQRNAFLKGGTVLRIPFYEQYICHMYWKARKIQDLLRSGDFQKQTPFHLLEAVEPFAARCYKDSLNLSGSLESRFKKATSQLYTKVNVDGSRASVLNTQLMLNLINISEKDLQNDATYNKMGPPDALELLNKLIQERSQKEKAERELLCELDEKKKEGIWTTLFGNPLLETALKDFFQNPKEGLALQGSKLIVSKQLKSLFALASDQTAKIKFLSLPNSPLLDSGTIRTLVEGCPNLEYLNVSGCVKLQEIVTAQGEWSLLARIEAQECPILEKFVSYSPLKVLRIETDRKIEIFLDKWTLDIFTISTKANQYDYFFKAGEGFHFKSQGGIIGYSSYLFNLPPARDISKYFLDVKITMGKYQISSAENLAVFITVLNLPDLYFKKWHIHELTGLTLSLWRVLYMGRPPVLRTLPKTFFGFIHHRNQDYHWI